MSDAAVARLALAISIAVALWQVLRYVLEGGRVRVRLFPGLLDEYWIRTGETWKRLEKYAAGKGGWPVEVAIVEIENLGRTPITISNPSLDLGRVKWWRSGRRTVGPRPLPAPGAAQEGTYRLEPFDRVQYVFDVWQVLTPSRGLPEATSRPRRVRATVRCAGKRRLRRSPWRTGWTVKPGQSAFVPGMVEIGLVTYRSLWRYTHDDVPARMACIPTAIDVREQYPAQGSPPSEEALKALMDSHCHGDGPPMTHMAAFYAARELVSFYEQAVPDEGKPTEGQTDVK